MGQGQGEVGLRRWQGCRKEVWPEANPRGEVKGGD